MALNRPSVPYIKTTDFQEFQNVNPNNPLPATDVDRELENVELTIDEIRQRLQMIQRDDGQVANKTIGVEQLKAELLSGVNPPDTWEPTKIYVPGDTVVTGTSWLLTRQQHLSAPTLQEDIDAGYWFTLIDLTVPIDNLITLTTPENWQDIDTVATNIEDINTTADNMPDINTVVANLLAITTNADNIADINTAAANIVDINNFSDVWQGAKANNPANRNDGSPLQAGDLYFNTALNVIRTWNGSSWIEGEFVPPATAAIVVDTVAQLKASSFPSGQLVETKGYYAAGDGGRARYLIQTAKGVDALSEELSNGNWAVMQSGVLIENITVYIPTDYLTLQAAIDDIHGRIQTKQGVIVDLMIEAGHILTAPLILSGGDYSAFSVNSSDEMVEVINNSLSISESRISQSPVFTAINGCNFPLINIKVDLRDYVDGSNDPSGSGFLCTGGSIMNIGSNGGCLGGQSGVSAYDGSVVNCPNTDFRFSRNAGITAWSNSKVYAENANASFSELYGVRSTEGASLVFKNGVATDCGRHASRAVAASFLDVTSADLRRSATKGVFARHSTVVMANFVDVRDCGEHGVYCHRGSITTCIDSQADGSAIGYEAENGGILIASVSSAKNCNTALIAIGNAVLSAGSVDCSGSVTVANITNGSRASLSNVTCDSPTNGITIDGACTVNALGANVTNSANSGIDIRGASVVNISGANFSGAGSNGVFVDTGSTVNFLDGVASGCNRGLWAYSSTVNARGANLSNAITNGVRAEHGADIVLRQANCRKGEINDDTDILCLTGSIIKTSQTPGGTNIPKNTPQANGIIFG